MKFTIENLLIAEISRRLLHAIVEEEPDTYGEDPDDDCVFADTQTGRQLLRADPGEVGFVVENAFLTARISLNSSSLEQQLIRVESCGGCEVEGTALLQMLAKSVGSGHVTMELREQAELDKSKTEIHAGCHSKPVLVLESPASNGTMNVASMAALPSTEELPASGHAKQPATVSGGDFARRIRQLGMAVGAGVFGELYANVLMRENGGRIELVTTNGLALARAFVTAAGCPKDLHAIVPFRALAAASQTWQEDNSLDICLFGDRRRLAITQAVRLSADVSGVLSIWIPQSADKFPVYEQIIEKLATIGTCNVGRALLDESCQCLSVSGDKMTAMTYEPQDGIVRLSKSDLTASVARIVPIRDATGSQLKLTISGPHLQLAAENCPVDELSLVFSGSESLVLARLGDGLDYYFQPFTAATGAASRSR